MTAAATRFVTPMTFEALSRHPVFHDHWALGTSGDIRHISLADEASLLLVAPATANILGKLAHGIADDALSTLSLATRAPVVVAPAMNVNMLEHPAVVENLETLRARGVAVVAPGSGYLACGLLGKGRLAETGEIVDAALAALARRRDFAGRTVLVTAGPTVEDIDPVRFVSNRSSGKMGYRLAEAARDRPADADAARDRDRARSRDRRITDSDRDAEGDRADGAVESAGRHRRAAARGTAGQRRRPPVAVRGAPVLGRAATKPVATGTCINSGFHCYPEKGNQCEPA